MSIKVLKVATEVQKRLLEKVLLSELTEGFWKNRKGQDTTWDNVTVEVDTMNLGPTGFKPARNCNFVNPAFFGAVLQTGTPTEQAIMSVVSTVDPALTVKQVKKQLIQLNQIVGGRITVVGGAVTKLSRGKRASPAPTVSENVSTKKAAARFTEEVSA